ncbi:O-methyltransferase [Neobacillus sp.]|uniref:O-methyltransferase n=1 Tax=Neobacillus sp. TaxID=2675273 RepID=UPI002899D3B5|nr:O-methyltransferase [Neobacillus sp.]
MGNDLIWSEMDEYFIDKLIPFDSTLQHVLRTNKEATIPEIDVSPTQGKLLYLLAKISGARNVLEIGTLGGYSSIWLARALPETGKVYTLEVEQEHAKIAEQNIRHAGCQNKVEVIVGKALDTLPDLKEKGVTPFDLIFIDADKPNNPHYLKWALKLAKSGALIIADNVVRNGEVIDEKSKDERVQGIRQFMDLLANEPRIESTAIQTVGTKGYDGFVISVVK